MIPSTHINCYSPTPDLPQLEILYSQASPSGKALLNHYQLVLCCLSKCLQDRKKPKPLAVTAETKNNTI